ncbi:hypothetical protein ACQHIV_40340 [Kribbella sp. GL6]|uniref:hypothetical protein n=1 Tax=Kribbella sp. GL6 TaxID=3419765 RepID=UPI003CFF3F0C
MKPVDEVEELLERAGARWRREQQLPPGPEGEPAFGTGAAPVVESVVGAERRVSGRWRRWVVPAVAAVGVGLLAAGVVAVVPEHVAAGGGGAAMDSQLPASQAQGGNESLLVKPGDRVQVSGLVIAAPGRTPVFCAFEDGFGVGYAPEDEPAPTCAPEFSIGLTGVDVDRLSGARTTKGVRSGRAKLVGIWGERTGAGGTVRTIDVREQSAPEAREPWAFPELPCPAPEGGWVSKPSNIYSPAVTAFLAAHADQVWGPVIHYPNGHSRNAPVVVMIGVAHGDLDAFRLAFEKVYTGNLCVAPVRLSRADNDRIVDAIVALTPDKSLGILAVGGSEPDGGRAGVSVIAYTERLRTALAPIGLDDIKVTPVVEPAPR